MKAIGIRQLDRKDEKIAEALISIGMSRPVARTLSYLQHTKETTSVELERGARLRQPEVSLSMKLLKERGWITEREEKMRGKGRPYKIYSLNIEFDELIDQIEKQRKKAVDEAQADIERLKKLAE